jgi:hypothetical protein
MKSALLTGSADDLATLFSAAQSTQAAYLDLQRRADEARGAWVAAKQKLAKFIKASGLEAR